jgi:hypothetical protein
MNLKINIKIKYYTLVKSKMTMDLKFGREHADRVPHVLYLDNGCRYYRSVGSKNEFWEG